MKTIGFQLHQDMPKVDEADAFTTICQRHQAKATIKIHDIEINPRDKDEVSLLADHAGHFVQVVTDGPDEAQLAAALHQQLAKDKYCN
ncbi:hypothetical protein FD13_GL000155 [Levilactobacillus senmaizukei DSM 21775 = NBRC 103853]|uniref:HPr domain-containing protein n=1 Tax=Levilactobacillus senmaizukei DSM 21775 = NBRC 103853 TaxID=1423803 RepID=A0A0R2DJR8_9LACO|nr:PTS sugar transporter [Levilactobacillus senmaizukei]KRN03371.1 hypothetical protein FD13_GL000155 [Levilactobacillus senmaizukei DSM 21775 = NBRC 103853]